MYHVDIEYHFYKLTFKSNFYIVIKLSYKTVFSTFKMIIDTNHLFNLNILAFIFQYISMSGHE